MNREARYVNSAENLGIFRSTSLNVLKPFYNGDLVKQRMDAIRKYILYIRQNWEKRDEFAKTLHQVMTGRHDGFSLNHCLQQEMDWGDRSPECLLSERSYDVIRLYTSEVGYNRIFKVINSIFRQEDSVSSEEHMISAVFLVELMNIALFNFVLAQPRRENFQGVVYRGMTITDDEIEAFYSLKQKQVTSRYISIPLSLMSTSNRYEVAAGFIAKVAREKALINPDEVGKPVIFKIHVIELPEHYLAKYRKKFPMSVVSTICAVNIDDLSDYGEEGEVLLRGPFFQVLDFYRDELTGWLTLEMVTVNSNRDHISTAFLGDDDGPARALFGAMVSVTRLEYALKYCEEHELTEDARGYETALGEADLKLSKLIAEK